MQYNFKGAYDSLKNYAVSDVVSYAVSGITRYYYCLSSNDPTNQQTPQSVDSSYWGIISALSNFPTTVDAFQYRVNITGNDKVDIARINELMLKTNIGSDEQTELNNLLIKHRNKLFLADDLNTIQDSISNLQMFFKTNVEGYITQKQQEMLNSANQYQTDINNTKDTAITTMESKKNSFISYMDSTTEGAIRRDMGDLSGLSTNDKTSLVLALNEINSSVSVVNDVATKAKEIVLKGTSAFNSNTGVVINHTIGNTGYYPIITPTQNPNGYLGEIWVEKANYSFKVLCSGSATTSFDYVVLVSSN